MILAGVKRAVVYERRGAWTIVDADELHVLGHPDTSSESALVCRLLPIQAQPPWLDELPLTDFLARTPSPGAPVLVDWSKLIQTQQLTRGWRESRPPSAAPTGRGGRRPSSGAVSPESEVDVAEPPIVSD